MPLAKYKVRLIVNKAKKDKADEELRKHTGSSVGWQELQGRGGENAPVTHYLYEDYVDQETMDAIKLVADDIPTARLVKEMRGRKTKHDHRRKKEKLLKDNNLKNRKNQHKIQRGK